MTRDDETIFEAVAGQGLDLCSAVGSDVHHRLYASSRWHRPFDQAAGVVLPSNQATWVASVVIHK